MTPFQLQKQMGCQHFCRMAERLKVPVLVCGGLFEDYNFHKVTALRADIAGMEALLLIYWLSKFVMEVAKKSMVHLFHTIYIKLT